MMISKRDFVLGAASLAVGQAVCDGFRGSGQEYAIGSGDDAALYNALSKEVAAISQSLIVYEYTNEFVRLSEKYNLEDRKSNLLAMQTKTDQPIAEGSAVFLGKDRIALCGHEIFGDQFDLTVFAKKFIGEKAHAKLLIMDKEHDIAIAKITSTGYSKRYGLVSVKRSETDYTYFDEDVVSVGYLDHKLHAIEGKTKAFVPIVKHTGGQVLCTIQADNNTRTWGGLSGGGLFKSDGSFLGLTSVAVGNKSACYVPASVIWDLVDVLDSAIMPLSPTTPEVCRLERRKLLTSILGKQ